MNVYALTALDKGLDHGTLTMGTVAGTEWVDQVWHAVPVELAVLAFGLALLGIRLAITALIDYRKRNAASRKARQLASYPASKSRAAL